MENQWFYFVLENITALLVAGVPILIQLERAEPLHKHFSKVTY